MNQWRKDVAAWKIGKTLYVSVPFTWLLPKAKEIIKKHSGPVLAGGPAVYLMPDYLGVEVGRECPTVRPLDFHNPLATFTSRGCVNNCGFCAVPKIEGGLKELDAWPVRPVVCDNNLLACSAAHFNRVIDRLKPLPYVDINQGLDARRFKTHHTRRLAELKGVKIRFAFDHLGVESEVMDAISLARAHGFSLRSIGVYVLIGFKDTPESARYRLETIRALGIRPNPMRYQPLGALEKNRHASPEWTASELARMQRYYSRLRWLEHIPYEQYKPDDLPLFMQDTAKTHATYRDTASGLMAAGSFTAVTSPPSSGLREGRDG